MNKKILLLLALVLASVSGAAAQQFSGRWSLYPNIGRSIDKIADTGTKTYFLTGKNLYHYSEEESETKSYANSGILSDTEISNIFWDYEDNKLLIAYSSSNIDILDGDGTVVNVPAIRDAILSTTKAIRDVDFEDNKAYIATDFGIVVIDMTTGNVITSGIYGFAPDNILVAGDKLLLYFKTEVPEGITANSFYIAPREGKLSSFTVFKLALTEPYSSITPVDDTHFLAISNDYWRTRLMTIDPATETITSSNRLTAAYFSNIRGSDGHIYAVGPNDCRLFDETSLTYTDTYAVPASIASQNAARLTTPFAFGKKGAASTWIGDGTGLAKYDLGTATQLMAPYFPQGITAPYPHLMRWGVDGKLWVSNLCGAFLYSNAGDADGVDLEKFVCTIEGDRIVDRTPTTDATSERVAWGEIRFHEADAEEEQRFEEEKWRNSWPTQRKNKLGTKYIVGGANHVQPDPDDPDLFWITTATDGMYLCKKGEGWSETNRAGDVLNIYSRIDAPYPQDYEWQLTRTYNVKLDPEGNLWVAFRHIHGDHGPTVPFIIMPRESRVSHPEDVKYKEWITHPGNGSEAFSANINMEFSQKSTMLFVTSACYQGPIYAVDTKGTYTDPSDDVFLAHNSILDQDNNPILPLYYTAIKEDKSGRVWFGYTEGVYFLSDPKDALTTETLRVRRPVVPREDGTNFGDYLLDGANISSIDIDAMDRKWFATFDAGVYLVNADGTKIIAHFDKNNSPLVSNTVYVVSCDPNSNRVFFGTDMGVMSYESDASPAQPDYSDVYVYPNPVRPEYNGWITVAGLMDNSMVKIADMNGNVVYQGRSSGGSFIWDGCNSAGERVRTGVYLVLASTGAESDTASAVVTKIMIMN